MIRIRHVAACALAMTLAGPTLEAQDFSRYRTFELGSSLAAVAALTDVAASVATTVHQRPALLQDLAWTPPRWSSGTNAESTDPVDKILFSFCNDRLFRISVDYSYERTTGMTEADVIEAISAVYGPVVKPARGVRVPTQFEIESGSPVARWGDPEHTVVLHRSSSYREAFRLILTDLALADVAKKAAAQSVKLDEQEAPQREVARQKKDKEDARSAAEKARATNKERFRP